MHPRLTRMITRLITCGVLLFGLARCDDSYPALTKDDGGTSNTSDGGSDPTPSSVVAHCGDLSGVPITQTTRGLRVDTADNLATVRTACGSLVLTSTATQAFIRIDALAGELWHVHVSSSDAEAAPRLAILNAACDERTCEAESDFCSGTGDEHTSFEAEGNGTYWVVITDTTGGGSFVVDLIRTTCGDGTKEHGEACDDGNLVDGDGCDRSCRVELAAVNPLEREGNDNRFEANALVLDGSSLSVAGSIGGAGACTYPDVFAISHPGGGLRVHADPATDGGCNATTEAPIRVRVMDAGGQVVAEESVDLTDCASLEVSDLAAGTYYIELSTPERPDPLAYMLTAEIL